MSPASLSLSLSPLKYPSIFSRKSTQNTGISRREWKSWLSSSCRMIIKILIDTSFPGIVLEAFIIERNLSILLLLHHDDVDHRKFCCRMLLLMLMLHDLRSIVRVKYSRRQSVSIFCLSIYFRSHALILIQTRENEKWKRGMMLRRMMIMIRQDSGRGGAGKLHY